MQNTKIKLLKFNEFELNKYKLIKIIPTRKVEWSLSNMPKDIINNMFLFMSHPTADIFRNSCICSSCNSFNKDKYRKICDYCNKYICKKCKVYERIIRKEDDQVLFLCYDCLPDKIGEIVADAKSRKIKISRSLKEYIEDTYGSDSD